MGCKVTTSPVKRLEVSLGPITSCAWIPQLKTVAVGTYPGSIFVIDAERGRVVRTLTAKLDGCGVMQVSPDGSLLAVAAGLSRERTAASGIMLFKL